MPNTIQLKFPGTLTRLSGNQYGKETYEAQVKEEINSDEKNIIVIPETIIDVGASFIQGFIADIPADIKNGKFYKTFEIQANNKITTKFREIVTR